MVDFINDFIEIFLCFLSAMFLYVIYFCFGFGIFYITLHFANKFILTQEIGKLFIVLFGGLMTEMIYVSFVITLIKHLNDY
ncbi:hypothetical protein [Lacrimispora amygdalina]|uniref:hypothetical protein n=1 Tax=Lacrimispora amygdalina TaxID=253257 RepID=UPI000BE48B8D|nr:hypothetical protein [Lacrimispora amygdalina]